MNVTSAQYKNSLEGVQDNIVATIDGKTIQVPLDTANRHYQAILEWAKEDSNEIRAAE